MEIIKVKRRKINESKSKYEDSNPENESFSRETYTGYPKWQKSGYLEQKAIIQGILEKGQKRAENAENRLEVLFKQNLEELSQIQMLAILTEFRIQTSHDLNSINFSNLKFAKIVVFALFQNENSFL